MLSKLKKLKLWQTPTPTQINELIDRVNLLSNVKGGGGVGIKVGPSNVNIWSTLTANEGTQVRYAVTTQDAPADTKITANVLNAYTGIEPTEGDDFGVDVYCKVVGGGNLVDAIPRLANDDAIFVAKLYWDNAGTPTSSWFCLTVFQAAEDCECTETAANEIITYKGEVVTYKGNVIGYNA